MPIRSYGEQAPKENNYNDLLRIKDLKILILRIISIVLAVVTVLLIVAVIIIAQYPKSQGYVIEITPDGSAEYNSDAVTLLEDWTPKDATINYFLRNFIIELRSVSSDPQIVTENIQKLYKCVTGNAARKATDYIEETDPRNRCKTETVDIAIASILPLSDTSYQVDFRETVWASGYRLVSDEHYRAVVHTTLYTPTTLEQLTFNPIGLYITDFDVSLVKEI